MSTEPSLLHPFPPVELVRPGLWSIPVPIPINALPYVFVYVFETDAGPYLVDTGWNTDEAYEALCIGLEGIGTSVAEVKGVLVTHIHPDHYGLAGRIREASGAWVALHPADAALITDRYVDPADLLVRVGAFLRSIGAPADELATLQTASMPVRSFVDVARPDVLIEDGVRPEVPGWDLRAIWTPGHSPGHLCFWETGHRLMLSGDHVLPHITPNISLHPQSGFDPLGDFLRALEGLKTYDADEVLPAHEYRFFDLPGRIAELVAHHEHRFLEVINAIRSGSTAAWDIATKMEWSRRWGEIEGFTKRAAVSEAMAHLRALEVRGVVRSVPGEPIRWELIDHGSSTR